MMEKRFFRFTSSIAIVIALMFLFERHIMPGLILIFIGLYILSDDIWK